MVGSASVKALALAKNALTYTVYLGSSTFGCGYGFSMACRFPLARAACAGDVAPRDSRDGFQPRASSFLGG